MGSVFVLINDGYSHTTWAFDGVWVWMEKEALEEQVEFLAGTWSRPDHTLFVWLYLHHLPNNKEAFWEMLSLKRKSSFQENLNK